MQNTLRVLRRWYLTWETTSVKRALLRIDRGPINASWSLRVTLKSILLWEVTRVWLTSDRENQCFPLWAPNKLSKVSMSQPSHLDSILVLMTKRQLRSLVTIITLVLESTWTSTWHRPRAWTRTTFHKGNYTMVRFLKVLFFASDLFLDYMGATVNLEDPKIVKF